jgi:hypothetical protein
MVTFCENIRYKIWGGIVQWCRQGYVAVGQGGFFAFRHFAQHLSKMTVSFVVSGHLSAWKSLALAGGICMQIDVEVFCNPFDD